MRKSIVIGLSMALAACGGSASESLTSTQSKTPGSPRSVELQGDPVTGAVASTVAISVKVVDSLDVGVPGAVVNFVVTAGGGTVFAPAVATSAAGIANQQWTFGTRAGAETIEARWIDPVSGAARVLGVVSATATPGALSKFSFPLGAGFSVLAGAAVASDVALKLFGPLTAADKFGNAISTSAAQFSVTGATTMTASSIDTKTPGLSKFIAGMDGLTTSGEIAVVDDLRGQRFKISYICSGPGAGQGDVDSAVVVLTGALPLYLTTSPASQYNQILTIPMSGTRTVWQATVATQQHLADTLRVGQRPDTLDLFATGLIPMPSAHAIVLPVSRSPLVFIGPTWCESGWTTRGVARFESY